MSAELDSIIAAKKETRRRIADLSIVEKLSMVERLRDDLLIALEEKRKSPPTKIEKIPNHGLQQVISEVVSDGLIRNAASQLISAAPEIIEELGQALSNPVRGEEALRRLFPEGIPSPRLFFSRLLSLDLRLGTNHDSGRLFDWLWSAAITVWGMNSVQALLKDLPLVNSPEFFQFLPSLQALLRTHPPKPEFLVEWFPALVRRIGNDLASSDFWKAVETLCEAHPRESLEVLRKLSAKSEDPEVSVAARLLGTLRTVSLSPTEEKDLACLAEHLRRSPVAATRSIHYRSWIHSAWRGRLTSSELAELLSQMSGGSAEDRDLPFWISTRSLLSQSIAPDVLELGISWLRANATSDIPSFAKHHVIDFVAQFAQRGRLDVADLAAQVQPIPGENKGTWKRLEGALVFCLRANLATFLSLFRQIAERNGNGLAQTLKEPRAFEWLITEMQTKDVRDLIGQFIFSASAESRRIGFVLFERIPVGDFSSELLEEIDDKKLRLAFYESQFLLQVQAGVIARFLIAILPAVLKSGAGLQAEFVDEVVLQSKNFAASREAFSERSKDFPLLEKALASADAYFECLTKARQSLPRAMSVAGFEHARRVFARRFSNAVNKSAREHSIWLSLINEVRIPYGEVWSSFDDGKLSNPAGFHQFSHSIEPPRLEYVDPEGMALRRLAALSQISSLSQEPAQSAT